jgi:hypothetical protein
MLSSPRRPDKTIRIFSSEECNLRAARRISLTTCSAGAFVVMGFAGAVLRFFIIFNSNWGKDEPQTLRYAITQNCSMGADGGHFWSEDWAPLLPAFPMARCSCRSRPRSSVE